MVLKCEQNKKEIKKILNYLSAESKRSEESDQYYALATYILPREIKKIKDLL